MIALLEHSPTAGAWFEALWLDALDIWVRGGWTMIALFVDALLLFALGVHTALRLWAKQTRVPEAIWRLWIEHPQHRDGRLGRLLDHITRAATLDESTTLFRGLRQAELAPVNRDLKVMKVCIALAPLLGLFGTVTGMLVTFGALAHGSGGTKTMTAISQGISEALITTETGLVIALPGLFFQYYLGRTRDYYTAFLAHLETVCTQDLFRRLQRGSRAA